MRNYNIYYINELVCEMSFYWMCGWGCGDLDCNRKEYYDKKKKKMYGRV